MTSYAMLMSEHVMLQQLHVQLRREMSELRRDAERYRWLAANCYGSPPDADPGIPYLVHETETLEDWRRRLDAAVDDAINPRTPEGEK
jgi:hypothetical protein